MLRYWYCCLAPIFGYVMYVDGLGRTLMWLAGLGLFGIITILSGMADIVIVMVLCVIFISHGRVVGSGPINLGAADALQ